MNNYLVMLIEQNPTVDTLLLAEVFEERAAIREYDGGYSREEAEKLAFDDCKTMF
jgi:hypothetical protein